MKFKIHTIFPFALFLFLVLLFTKGMALDPRQLTSPMLNQDLPEFSLPTVNNPKPNFTDESFEGKVSLLHVFASWCGICGHEMPFLAEIAKTSRIPIYGLAYKDDRGKLKQWLKNHGNPFVEVGMDDIGDVSMELGLYGTPETFIVDKKGVIRYKHVGAVTPAVWRNRMLPIIEKLRKQ